MNGPKIEQIPGAKKELIEIRESVEDALHTEGTSYHGNIASVLWDTLKHIETGLDKLAESNMEIAKALNHIANAISERKL